MTKEWWLRMAENKLKKVAYNRPDKAGWIENRDFLDYKQSSPDSTFLNMSTLEYSGRKLLKVPITRDTPAKPVAPVDVGIIDF